MLKYWLGVVIGLFSLVGSSQVENPIEWKFASTQVEENIFELSFSAKLEPHWHVYSTTLSGDEGPVPTAIDIKLPDGAELVGGIIEPKPIKEFDKNFQMDLLYFDNEVTFSQRVKVPSAGATVTGELTYMVCDDSKCLPPDYLDFSFDLKPKGLKSKSLKAESKAEELKEAQPLIQAPEENQIFNPVTWEFKANKISEQEYELVMTATIGEGWHLYSQTLESMDGPVPTEFRFFNDAKNFELHGKTIEEGDVIKEYDDNFMMNLSFYTGDVSFKQNIKINGATSIKGDVYYMVCDDSKCLPPEAIEFDIPLPGTQGAASVNASVEDLDNSSNDTKSFWEIFIIAFLSGFAALLTPCVFPMIPMTVSFFTKQSKTKAQGIRNAILYGLSIIIIYVLLGTVVTAVFGSEALNELATNVWFNLIFFVLLVVFAISFLGAFEIVLPSSWVNAADRGADKGGLIGIFFMAFTLALVSFSCTGPIVGTLIVEAAAKGGIMPIVGMFGFSLAIALPFGLFAAFPGWLNSLPQSGGWLNSVKVVLGFLELGLAIKFLSNADLVVQGGYITREIFIAFWIVISIMLGMYLLGKIRLPHDSPIEKLSVGRTMMAIVVFTFAVYLIPGMWGAPLKLIAGFPPPMNYSESAGGSFMSSGSGGGGHSEYVEGTHPGPQNLPVFHNLQEGMAYAKKVNKSLFVDFTGHACANCRKMEQKVWGEPGIIDMLTNDVVIVSLYVDDRTKLPEDQQREVKIGDRTKKIKTIGDEWMVYQVEQYKTNTQPYYVMLGPNGEDLTNGSADFEHHSDPEDFRKWLSEGLALYKSAK